MAAGTPIRFTQKSSTPGSGPEDVESWASRRLSHMPIPKAPSGAPSKRSLRDVRMLGGLVYSIFRHLSLRALWGARHGSGDDRPRGPLLLEHRRTPFQPEGRRL